MIRDHLYVLAVPDLERSASFYRDTLGFSIHEMGDPGWRTFARMAAGAEIVKPLADEAWGMREFGLRTADCHRIMIGHALPGA